MKRILLAILCILMCFGCFNTTPDAETTFFSQKPSGNETDTVQAAPVQAASVQAVTVQAAPVQAADSGHSDSPPVASFESQDTAGAPVKANILVAGDLMCLYAQLCAAHKNGKYNFDYCFDKIKEKVSSADLAIGNLETLVASGYTFTKGNQKGNPKMDAPESFLSAAAGCGFDVLTNANNHILDRKADGINKTIAALDKYGVKHTGAYAAGETRDQLIVNVKGINVAILAYTDLINNRPKKAAMVDKYSAAKFSSDIAAVKEAGADFIIVFMHWGTERTHRVTSGQKKQAAYMAKAGADIIIGSHPHCVQGSDSIETDHGSVPVFYSLGNYVSSMGATMCKDGMMVNISLEKDPQTGKTSIFALTYTATYCTTNGGKSYVILPADLESISGSIKADILKNSRARIIKVVGTKAGTPE